VKGREGRVEASFSEDSLPERQQRDRHFGHSTSLSCSLSVQGGGGEREEGRRERKERERKERERKRDLLGGFQNSWSRGSGGRGKRQGLKGVYGSWRQERKERERKER